MISSAALTQDLRTRRLRTAACKDHVVRPRKITNAMIMTWE
jgi:hypothetical protein